MTTSSPADKATEAVDQALTRAQAAAQAKRFGEAAGICNDVLATAPDNAPALALLGMIAAHTNDPERGITMLERAVTLRPGVSSWYANLCALYRLAYRMQDALRVGQEAIRLDPQNADHLVNLSLVFTDVDDRDHAVACLLRALGLRPDHADGHLALGQNLLATGEFEPGWVEYEWRNQTEAGKGTLPKMTSAMWNGMRIPNGRLLMVGDQGYGDTIQFARYIPLIADRCQELILGCSAEMGPLLATIPGVKQYCHRWTDVPGHAAHCRLSSVPGLVHTTLETIPATVPYLFADPSQQPIETLPRYRELAEQVGGFVDYRRLEQTDGVDLCGFDDVLVVGAGGAKDLARLGAERLHLVATSDIAALFRVGTRACGVPVAGN